MTAIELKNILIHKISEINDISFLEAIRTIVDSKVNNEILQLTEEQRNGIIASKSDIERGRIIDNDDLDNEIQAWLKEK
jgi:hypothetical protein